MFLNTTQLNDHDYCCILYVNFIDFYQQPACKKEMVKTLAAYICLS